MGDSPTLRERIRQAIKFQPQRTVTVLSSLLAIQDRLGYIPQEAIQEVAESTGVSINDVWAVVSFYTNFRLEPPGKHVVEVCWGPTCHLCGAQKVLEEVQETVGLKDEGTTDDGRVTLKYNTCLGACAQGPVIAVDHRLMGRLTPEQARDIIARLNGHQH